MACYFVASGGGRGFHVGMQWYYAINGQRSGPVAHAEFERLVQSGTVGGDELVWRQGMDQWQTLAEVKAANPGLIAEAPPPLPVVTETVRMSDEAVGSQPVVPVFAGFGRRCAAYVIDAGLWFFIWLILINVIVHAFFPDIIKLNESIAAGGGAWSYKPTPEEIGPMMRYSATMLLVTLCWTVLYDAIFVLKYSATPGKLLLGIKLVQANGEPLGFAQIVARCLAKGLVALTLGIGYLVVAFDDEKRGLHDYVCNTRVVKKRR